MELYTSLGTITSLARARNIPPVFEMRYIPVLEKYRGIKKVL